MLGAFMNMFKVGTCLLSHLTPAKLINDSAVRQRYAFLMSILLTLGGVVMLFSISNLIQGLDNSIAYYQMACVLTGLAFVKWSRSYVVAAASVLAVLIFGIGCGVILFRSFPYTVYYWMPVTTGITFYIFEKRWHIALGIVLSNAYMGTLLYVRDLFPGQSADLPASLWNAVALVTMIFSSAAMGWICYSFTISIRRINALLESQNRKLQQQNEEINTAQRNNILLLSILSHDVISPITVAMHTATLGEKGQLSDHIANYRRVLDACERAVTIIRDVGKLHSIQTGKANLQLTSVDLPSILYRIRDEFQERLTAKNLTLKINYPPTVPQYVNGEENALLNNIFNNLISNAIKFSHPDKEIVVEAREVKEAVQIAITDSGIGIPDELVQHIFDIDKQTTRKGTQGETGTGFGLPIVKTYVEYFGGSIEVRSRTGTSDETEERSGTTFTLTLKQASPPGQTISPPQS
jgi:signal transduction histidine kinase